jgi:hypothetical protein
MPVGGMIWNKVQDQLHIPLVDLFQKFIKILQVAKKRMNVLVV